MIHLLLCRISTTAPGKRRLFEVAITVSPFSAFLLDYPYKGLQPGRSRYMMFSYFSYEQILLVASSIKFRKPAYFSKHPNRLSAFNSSNNVVCWWRDNKLELWMLIVPFCLLDSLSIWEDDFHLPYEPYMIQQNQVYFSSHLYRKKNRRIGQCGFVTLRLHSALFTSVAIIGSSILASRSTNPNSAKVLAIVILWC